MLRARDRGAALAEEVYYNIAGRHRLPEHRFVIFAQGRSGSTLMTSLLDSHPEIRCHDELLQRPRLAPLRYIDQVARTASASHHGFHLKIYQLKWNQRGQDPHAFMDALESRGMRIIYLWRENVLDTNFSNYFARATGVWHYRSNDSNRPDLKIRIDPDELHRSLDKSTQFLKEERDVLSGRSFCEVNYERDLLSSEHRDVAMQRIQEFLGVTQHVLKSPLKKSVKRPIADLIENYDEIVRALEDTPYALMLPQT